MLFEAVVYFLLLQLLQRAVMSTFTQVRQQHCEQPLFLQVRHVLTTYSHLAGAVLEGLGLRKRVGCLRPPRGWVGG